MASAPETEAGGWLKLPNETLSQKQQQGVLKSRSGEFAQWSEHLPSTCMQGRPCVPSPAPHIHKPQNLVPRILIELFVRNYANSPGTYKQRTDCDAVY